MVWSKLLKPYLAHDVGAPAGFIAVALLQVVNSGALVALSFVQRDLTGSLSRRERTRFLRSVLRYVSLIAVLAPLIALKRYVQGRTVLRWREWVTNHLLNKYFDGDAFYRIRGEEVELRVSASSSDVDPHVPGRTRRSPCLFESRALHYPCGPTNTFAAF